MHKDDNEGYKFFKDTLGSPKFVVAPMVEQSELAWRMLARKHKAQLCFTPMYSANTFVNDCTYRKKVLDDLSCKDDRPLIVQFCSNTVINFLKASFAIQQYCDGVDLNLGCPQHIARRGHFGAFLQDDWDVISSILCRSRKELQIGVSAKIRVFPEIDQTVQYAKMLENSGCHFITVHGRTREQKGPLTGKASWAHIKAVKENVAIPVISNGNIQFTKDIFRCLDETGVDGVMLAEGHLSNPYIFEGVQPYVQDVAEEYFKMVEKYPCPLSYSRTHLFRLWAHALLVHKDMRERLGRAETIDKLKAESKELSSRCLKDKESGNYCLRSPHWICQPYIRPDRLPENRDIKKTHNEVIDQDEKMVSKNEARRLRRYQRRVEMKKVKRKKEHERRRQRDREMLQLNEVRSDRVLRRSVKKEAINKRLKDAMDGETQTITVCVDLGWSANMNEKEINKLSGQLGRMYGSNRNAVWPAQLYFTSFQPGSKLWCECLRKHDGFSSYLIHMKPEPYLALFCLEKIVYLTPDAEEALDSLDTTSVYVLGGLVDETVVKKLTLDGANKLGLCVRRLPVQELMHRASGRSNYSTVYSINQVFDVLLTFYATKCWHQALKAGVPSRKGYIFT